MLYMELLYLELGQDTMPPVSWCGVYEKILFVANFRILIETGK